MKVFIATAMLWISLPAFAVELMDAAPDFTLKSLSGEELSLEAHRGDVVLVNFWASWCGRCRSEMSVLDHIHSRYKDLGFTVLGVNVDEDPEKARRVAEKIGVSFPLLLDSELAVSKRWDIKAMPYTVLIDRSGEVRFINKGYQTGDETLYADQLHDLFAASGQLSGD